MRKILLVSLLLLSSPALAQFPASTGTLTTTLPAYPVSDPGILSPAPGGPVAIGQVQAQKSDDGKVTILQAPPAPAEVKSGGIVQLSAFGWLEPYVDTVVQALIAAGFAWIGKSKYSQWLDQSGRDALETFVKNRASSLIADGAVSMRDKSVHVDNPLLYRAAAEASTAIPDALKRFGLSPDVVAAKIVDAIPQTTAGAAIIAASHAENDAPPVPVPAEDRPSAAPRVATPNQMPPTSADA
jgi:hypothetical protein